MRFSAATNASYYDDSISPWFKSGADRVADIHSVGVVDGVAVGVERHAVPSGQHVQR